MQRVQRSQHETDDTASNASADAMNPTTPESAPRVQAILKLLKRLANGLRAQSCFTDASTCDDAAEELQRLSLTCAQLRDELGASQNEVTGLHRALHIAEQQRIGMRAERDDERVISQQWEEKYYAAEAERDSLRTALETYGAHTLDCKVEAGEGDPEYHPCTCGLRALLTPDPAKEP